MKRFSFRLDRLLNLRQQRLREVDLETAQLGVKIQSIYQRIHEGNAEVERLSSEGESASNTPWWHVRHQTERILNDIRSAEMELAQLAEQLREVQQKRAKAAAGVKALETLREDRWNLFRLEWEREQQSELHEHILKNWGAGSSEPGEEVERW
ncbi:MAG: hypothetical protein R3E01_20475 [Pirellulaceae bacterium]|nr:hypothetical protein [Planctomycetales bacterium]MCA9266031.1 hypothetical protein [Planctomycetales bacterium]